MAEGEGITATEEGRARGEFSGGILYNFIVTLFTPKCNLCNLDYNLGAKPLNSLKLIHSENRMSRKIQTNADFYFEF